MISSEILFIILSVIGCFLSDTFFDTLSTLHTFYVKFPIIFNFIIYET